MKAERFVAIGHITNDLATPGIPFDHLGGAVSYSAVTAKRLGSEAHIITKAPDDHPYVRELRHTGVKVHILPSKIDRITTFKNIYDSARNRQQVVTDKQEPITKKDYDSDQFPKEILNNATVLVAPVIEEVDSGFLQQLQKVKLLGLSPQGYFREVGPGGKVVQKRWSELYKYLSGVDITILSQDDIIINNQLDNQLLQEIIEQSFHVILTKGDKGSTNYINGEVEFEAGAFFLKEDEVDDLTGAGDVFSGAYLTELMKAGATSQTAAFAANLYTALKIMKKSGVGIDSIPNEEQYREFRKEHRERVNQFIFSQTGRKKFYSLSLFKKNAF